MMDKDIFVMVNWKSLLVMGIFILMPFSEYRAIYFCFPGYQEVHAISVTMIYYAIVLIAVITSWFILNGMKEKGCWKEKSFIISAILLTVSLLSIGVGASDDVSFINLLMLVQIACLYIFTYMLFSYVNIRVIAFLFLYFSLSFSVLICIGLFLIKFAYPLLVDLSLDLYNPAFVTMVRPHQASLYFGVTAFLGVGASLHLKKHYWVFVIVPIYWLGVLETGSRATTFLAVNLWGVFLLIYIIGCLFSKHFRSSKLSDMRCLVAVSLLVLLMTMAMDIGARTARALTIFSCSYTDILSGKCDPVRYQLWKGVIHGPGGSLHNVFADIYFSSGLIPLVLFISFLVFFFFNYVLKLYGKIDSDVFPVLCSVLAGLILILGQLYANPTFPMPFVWFFFGLALNYINAANRSEV